jgi:hypothetical protein
MTGKFDEILRDAAREIAAAATEEGDRASLGDIQGQILLFLVEELRARGINQSVIADMLGLVRRSYYGKVRRLGQRTTSTETLWSRVVEALSAGEATSASLSCRFYRDDPVTLRAVLGDLVSSGRVYRSGSGVDAVYRARPREVILSENDYTMSRRTTT